MPRALTKTERPAASAYDAVSSILGRYLSELNAEGILSRALRETSLRRDQLALSDVASLLPRLERGIRLFLDPGQQHRLRAELEQLAREHAVKLPAAQTIPVEQESDISVARLTLRAVCVELGMRALYVQRVVTIVSELARNIVDYTPGGTLQVTFRKSGAQRVMMLVARDRGTGIDNLDVILAGHYQSRMGLGKGLFGVKRLADSFDIRTGPNGTCITLEVKL